MIIYLAAPIDTYDTPRYRSAAAQLKRMSPKIAVVGAADLFDSNEDWIDRWPSLLDCTKALAFIDREDGTIGRGVDKEIQDALRRERHIPVSFLTSRGEIVPWNRITLMKMPGDSWKYWAFVKVQGG